MRAPRVEFGMEGELPIQSPKCNNPLGCKQSTYSRQFWLKFYTKLYILPDYCKFMC